MSSRMIYICRVCHNVDQRPTTCHPGKSAKCDIGAFGDERSRPLFDDHGRLVTRAPKWWVDACIDAKESEEEKGGRASDKHR